MELVGLLCLCGLRRRRCEGRTYWFYVGIIIAMFAYYLSTSIFSCFGFKDNNIIPYRSKVLYEIRQCEKELPRNQECEIMISAVPKQEEK